MSAGIDPRHRTFATPERLAQHVADWIVERAREQPHRFALSSWRRRGTNALYELISARAARRPSPVGADAFVLGQ